jgi:proline-specific peptidase
MTNIPIRDISLFVEVIGKGYPILFMHGGPGLDHSTLLPLQPCADSFTLIYYDHRCNGRSVGANVSTMTWENLTADADVLRETLGYEKWAVLGHSFGGMVALEYALHYPASVSHLLLMDTCADIWWVQHNAPKILAKRGYNATAVQAARRFFNGQLTSNEVFPLMLKFFRAYSHHPSLMAVVREIVLGIRVKMCPEALIFGFSKLLVGWSVMDRLSEITMPTLVLAGRHDFQFPPEHQAILADRISNAQLELIEQAGHNAPIDNAAEVIRVVKGFMNTRM